MLRWLIRSTMNYRLLVLPIAAAVTFIGVIQLRDAPVDVLPEFTPPYVEIQTEALGLSASEVEQLITAPLEADMLNQVAWIDQIRSESVPGLSQIELVFEPGTNILDARQMVQERLLQAGDMPNVAKPPSVLQPMSSTNRVMMIGLSSDQLSLIEQSVLARWKIKPRILGVPGVANVVIWGQRERQLQVHVDPIRLQQNGVQLSQVIRTTGNALWVSPLSFLEASTPGSGGFVESPSQRFGIQHVSPITTAESLAQVTLEDPTGRRLRLGDVTNVVEDHQPLIGDAIVEDSPNLMLVVEKFPGFNTIDVTRGIEEALEALRPGLPGMKTETVYRPASYIESSLDNLGLAALIGAVLVVALIGLLLFDWRGLISVVAIPVALVAAGLVLYVMRAGFNTLILSGFVIAIGTIVDDAIADIDNIKRRLREERGDDNTSTAGLILRAAIEVRGPLAYASLIMLVAAVPFFFLGGLTGTIFASVGLAYLVALLVSMIVALTVTPALALLLYGRPGGAPEARGVRALHSGHSAVLSRFAGQRWLAVAVAGMILLAGFVALPMLLNSTSTVPTLQDRQMLVNWSGVPGTSLQEIDRITQRASVELRALPGVSNVGAHVGRAIDSDQSSNINSGQVWITLDSKADYALAVKSVKQVVAGYPGLRSEVLTYAEARMAEVRAEAGRPLVVRVYGQDAATLRTKAQEIQRVLTGVGGVVDPRVDLPAEEATVEIEVNLTAAQQHGVKPGDVRRAAATLLSGVGVGSLFEEQKVFDVVVWGTPTTRHSVTNIKELLIDKPGGGHVRMGDVAEVRIRPHPVVVKRNAVSRVIDVVADIQGRDLGSVTREVQQRVRSDVSFPVETHAEVLGHYAEQQNTQRRAWIIALAAAIGIYLLLQAAFGSWRLATILFLSLPLALAGGALAAAAVGEITTLGSLIGFLAVLGLAARHGILLIKRYELLAEEGDEHGLRLVLRGTRERITPMVLTTLATALILLPFVIRGPIPGYELVYPLAIVTLGGLVTSTVLNLFVVPALYLGFASPSTAPRPPATTADVTPTGSPA